jgi:predicted nucleotidyltransferase
MTPLSPEQIASVRQLQMVCDSIGAEIAIIGAIALRVGLGDRSRHTEDVDVAIAIDLDDFPRLTSLLQERGWMQDGRREHRWRTSDDARLDLIPAGPALRKAQELRWPASKMRMSLVGFEHVFADSAPVLIAPDLNVKIAPLAVVALLKMVAYLEKPHEREKDVEDWAAILRLHEPEDSRRYSDETMATQLDYEAVGAYWIGKDLRVLCSVDEGVLVERFATQLRDERSRAYHIFMRGVTRHLEEDGASRAEMLIDAFQLGFDAGTERG